MNFFKIIGPGILVAATGIGAGDLITAGLTGVNVGMIALWTPLIGALLKFSLSEGLTRWQLATDTTLIEGWKSHGGKWAQSIFLFYLIIWSYMVGGALINACSIAGDALFSLGEYSKIIWGIVHSLLGLFLVTRGNFEFFEKLMTVLIGIMFIGVITFSIMILPEPSVNLESTNPWPWLLGVLGGVGGTMTILSYGYWIKEAKRSGQAGLKICRIDLGTAYFVTSLFSCAMIIIGSKVQVTEKNNYALLIATGLETHFGVWASYLFLSGFWAGVFCSLLGVWQSVPYLFSDGIKKINTNIDLRKTKAYRWYGLGLALIPLTTLWINFETIQLSYAIMGAFFMPILATSLLFLNNMKVMGKFKNGILSNATLIFILIFFSVLGLKGIKV